MSKINMEDHIRHSNLIENIDNPREDAQSLKAWQWLEGVSRIDQSTLLELHRLITVNQLEPYESGQYRGVPVSVGGRMCPSPYLARELIHNWLLDLKEHWKTLAPKEMHIRFEKIHPFVDGNGRTGRMLMWWHERKLGREPTLIRSNHADRYYYYGWFKEETRDD